MGSLPPSPPPKAASESAWRRSWKPRDQASSASNHSLPTLWRERDSLGRAGSRTGPCSLHAGKALMAAVQVLGHHWRVNRLSRVPPFFLLGHVRPCVCPVCRTGQGPARYGSCALSQWERTTPPSRCPAQSGNSERQGPWSCFGLTDRMPAELGWELEEVRQGCPVASCPGWDWGGVVPLSLQLPPH